MKPKQFDNFIKKYSKRELAETLIKTWHYNAFLRETLAMEIFGGDFDIDVIDDEEIDNLEDFLKHTDKGFKPSVKDKLDLELNNIEIT